MVNASAIEYVQKLLKDGYSLNEIRSHLINSGFSPLEVNSAIDQLHLEKKVHISKKVLFLSILVLFVVGLGVFLFSVLSSSAEIAYYDLLSSKNVVSQGGSLVLDHSFVFSGKSDVEIALLHEVLFNEKNVYSFEEKVLLKPAVNTILNLPSTLEPGDYEVKVSFKFNDEEFSDILSFAVQKRSIGVITEPPKSRIDSCPSVCNDFNDCTRDSCKSGVCVFDPVTFCCGNNICESSESESSCSDDCKISSSPQDYVLEAKRLSATDANSAGRVCSKIASRALYNDCFFEVSVNSGNALFCSPISDVDYRDSCYSKIAINKKDHNLCNNIIDKSLRDNCNLLISLI